MTFAVSAIHKQRALVVELCRPEKVIFFHYVFKRKNWLFANKRALKSMQLTGIDGDQGSKLLIYGFFVCQIDLGSFSNR